MSNTFEKLRKQVLAEVQKERARVQNEGPVNRAQLLGTFLQASLSNLGLSNADFARRLNAEQELADALLDGLLPASEIDDLLLDQVAKAIDYDPALLRILLGRETPASKADNTHAPAQ